MSNSRHHIALLPTYIGAAVSFVAFLFIGAVPGVLYGGYMGMAMHSVLFGAPVEGSWLGRLLVGGGMGLGLAATLFFFLVAGAVAGTLVGLPFAGLLQRAADEQTAPQGEQVVADQH